MWALKGVLFPFQSVKLVHSLVKNANANRGSSSSDSGLGGQYTDTEIRKALLKANQVVAFAM